jgi:predicted nucleic acid-binding protein
MRLIDADVIIWNWRGQEDAALLLADSPFAVSAVTYMELVQGMRNRREFAKLRADLKLWQVRLLPVTEPISARAVALVERHFLPHHVQLADALVAATALQHDLVLVSSNSKHFRPVQGLRLERFRPRQYPV